MERGSASKEEWNSQPVQAATYCQYDQYVFNPCHMPHCLVTAIFNPCRMQQWRLKQSTAMWATLGAGSSNATLFGLFEDWPFRQARPHFEVVFGTCKAWLWKQASCVLESLSWRCRRWPVWCKGLCRTWGFCRSFKKDGRRGTYAEDLARCKRITRDMCIRAVRRSGCWFPQRCCILEHQIFRFAAMILRDRYITSYDLASIFRGRRSTLDKWSGKIAKRIGTRPSALHSTFHFGRKSGRIVSFLMLSTSKIAVVSQNCLVFDVVKFKKWGSLAEFFRFWCCQVQKLRTSRRIASFSSLRTDRQTDRQTDR